MMNNEQRETAQNLGLASLELLVFANNYVRHSDRSDIYSVEAR